MQPKKILIFAPYGLWTVHHQVDAVIGAALKARGADVAVVGCDGILEHCPIAGQPPRKEICEACHASGKKLFGMFQLPMYQLGDVLPTADREACRQWADNTAPEDFTTALYQEAEIGKWVSPGVHSRMTTGHHDLSDPNTIRIFRNFLYNGALLVHGMKRVIAQYQPDHLICYSAMHAFYYVAFMLARQQNIPTLVHERGTVDDTFLFIDSNTIIESDSRLEAWTQWQDVPLNNDELTWVQTYVEDREHGRNMNFFAPYDFASSAADARRVLGCPVNRKLVCIFPSNDWEYGIWGNSGDQTFDTQMEGFKAIIEALPPEDYVVAIRLHPPMGNSHFSRGACFLEEMLSFSQTLPGHVRLISPREKLTSYALLWNADAAITFGSTIGVEGLMRGVSPVGLVRNVYSGVVPWVQSKRALPQAVHTAVQRTQGFDLPDLRQTFRNVQFLFNRINFRFESFGIRNHYEPDIRIRSLDQLATGHDASLDHICDHMLEGQPLYAPPTDEQQSRDPAVEERFLARQLDRIRRQRGQVHQVAHQAQAPESLVTVVRSRQNGIRDQRESHFMRSAERSRHRNIEWQRYFEMALPRQCEAGVFVAEFNAAVKRAKGNYLYMGVDAYQVDEAWFSGAVSYLEDPANQAMDGVVSGIWIRDEKGPLQAELFMDPKSGESFAQARERLPLLRDPAGVVSCCLCRTKAWRQIAAQLSGREPQTRSQDLAEYLYNLLLGPAPALAMHRLHVPLITVNTPPPDAELMERGIRLAREGRWEDSLEALERIEETESMELQRDLWRAVVLDGLGRTWEAVVLFSSLSDAHISPDQLLPNDRLQSLLDRIRGLPAGPRMRYQDIAASVDAVEGWLEPGQEQYLFEKVRSLPDGAVILEIGSCFGRSTTAMAYACFGTRKRIYAIDTFLGNEEGGGLSESNSYFDVFRRNLRQRGLQDYVHVLQGTSQERMQGWDQHKPVDFAFIDASHLYVDVIRDVELVYPHVKDGGWMALHDVLPNWPGPWRAWKESLMSVVAAHEYQGSIACGRKQSGQKLSLPAQNSAFDYGRHWVECLQPLIPQLAEALACTLQLIRGAVDPSELKRAEAKIAIMPDHPLLRKTLWGMARLEAGQDPIVRYWQVLTLVQDNQADEALTALAQGLVSAPAPLKQRLEQIRLALGGERPAVGMAPAPAHAEERTVSGGNGQKPGKGNGFGPADAGDTRSSEVCAAAAHHVKFQDHIRTGDTVLEFACRGGHMLQQLRCGRRIGVALGSSDLQAAQQDGIEAYASSEAVPEDIADVLICYHGLGCVENPLQELRTLRGKLKAGGKLVCVVPLADAIEAPAPGDRGEQLYSWNRQTLGNLFKRAQFDSLEIDRIDHQIRIVAQKQQTAGMRAVHAPGLPQDEIPVALITYNRPDHTRRVLQALRRHQPKHLYLFSDAPKTQADAARVHETREVLKAVDWTEPVIVTQESNQGLARSITAATDRVLENHDRLILLEDDCVPQVHFFDFMQACLDRYESNPRIFGVSGYTVQLSERLLHRYPYDIYFAPRIGSWGWATWKRAWQQRINDLSTAYTEAVARGIDLEQGGNDVPAMLAAMMRGELKDVWTINWILTVYLNDGRYIYPTRSHVENIGMDGSGVHCGATDKFKTTIARQPAVRFPDEIVDDAEVLRQFRQYYDHPVRSPSVPVTSTIATTAAEAPARIADPSSVNPPREASIPTTDLYVSASATMRQGRIEEAIPMLEEVIDRDPDHAMAHHDLAVLCQKAGRTEQALHHHQTAAALEPNNVLFQRELGHHFWYAMGEVQSALEYYVKALNCDPRDVESLMSCGRICIDMGRSKDARDFFSLAQQLEPWNEEARELMAQL